MNTGEPLIPFWLIGTDGNTHDTTDFRDKIAITIIFICNHCPYVRAYVSRIRDIAQKYNDLNVGFFLINSNDPKQYPEDSFQNMILLSEHLGVGGNYLYDESQQVAVAYGAQRTPEAYLFDRNKKLVYHGAIDDSWENPDNVSIHYLEAAIDTVLDEEEVLVKETQAIGCSIKWKK